MRKKRAIFSSLIKAPSFSFGILKNSVHSRGMAFATADFRPYRLAAQDTALLLI